MMEERYWDRREIKRITKERDELNKALIELLSENEGNSNRTTVTKMMEERNMWRTKYMFDD